MQFATDNEIKIAHDALLKGKKTFDKSRENIIKENRSCYVQACPGSGKTTALLAKLVILSNKMPLPEGKGVCVLTHTNVAIDEIKAKLGTKADVLFRYPNFFGTIQTFLHKYITAAALHYFYGSQIAYVDNDVANAALLKIYDTLTFTNKLKKLIYAHVVSKAHIIETDEIEILGGIDILTSANVINNIGKRVRKYDFQLSNYDWNKIPKDKQELIRTKKDNIIAWQGKELILSFKVDWLNNKIYTDSNQIRMETEAGAEYIKLKEEMFAEGILSFDDAYDLAFRYIHEKNLSFSDFSDKRFQYLFVDEVQDCDNLQVELIKKIFADDKVIIQRFGDYCQAIYDVEEKECTENNELKGDNVLYIHDSNRFGENIAKPLRTLCMENNHALHGNPDVHSAKSIIITYEDPLSVLPKYANLLSTTLIPEMGDRSVLEIAEKEREEDPLHRVNLKACGWVGKKGITNKRRLIESYFPSFEKKNVKQRVEGNSFEDFILKTPKKNVKDCAISIIQGILKVLDLCDVKNGCRRYTRTSFLDFLHETDIELKEMLLQDVMSWSLLITQSHSDKDIHQIKDTIYQYIVNTLLPIFAKSITQEATEFFNVANSGTQDGQVVEQGNVYVKDGIEIEIATVHAVKGETHASTLYLETSYFGKHESERLSAQFKGIPYIGTDERILSSLKVAYVGMSRPRYLLCVAIQKDRFDKMDCPELREIWNVVEV
ncbi:MAG: UvrD-helicase domain-containing protein [Massilibacteroides sp.]|nr:UvrD-helicase domain-containing protein [Massilibacteroides sp.]